MPSRVLDCHAHVYLTAHRRRPPTEKELAASFGTHVRDFGVGHLFEALTALMPGPRFEALVFGLPLAYLDIDAQNDYVAEHLADPRVHGLALLDPRAGGGRYADLLTRDGFLGFKPYHALVDKPTEQVSIRDMIPPAARRQADQHKAIIMLHVPRAGRIADGRNIDEVCELCSECPQASVILAHVGRSYGPWFIEQAIDHLAPLSNLYYDIAALDDTETIEVVLGSAPHSRLLFGTDLPVTAHRGKHLCVNRQCLFLTRDKHPWSISSEESGALNLTFFVYETLRALKRAAGKTGLTRGQVEDVFHGNARRIIDRARGAEP
ncbi:MAG: amidohydrolase family protein [Armatimonadia bacterium]|nr:amidohydrolase family protein [Armatimonadia bacterium]